MKVSLNWAQWYSDVDLKAKSTEELVKLATERLGGVEGYTGYTECYKNIYVAKIIEVKPHPNADKLRVCKVDDGKVAKSVERDENGYVQIVCGAPVVEEGWLVGWLAPGASVPGWYEQEVFTLEPKELRGEISYGMMGTPKELGVSNDESGLLVINQDEFSEEVKPGMSFAKLLGMDDLVIDIENKMFTHRPDCFGILGVAREIAGIQHKSYISPDWYVKKPTFQKVENRLKATMQNAAGDLAPRVMMVPMDGIKVGPSPLWMQANLTKVGIKPINNIVDITNYAMYLTAQPMHAFDYDKLVKHSNNGVVMGPRMAKKNEKLTLLGSKQVTLTEDDIVLATDKVAVDIAGVMGGEETEVDENTKSILLTCCSFDMYAVRRMTMRHGVFTDAATRNTKGQPPAQVDRVLAYAMKLIGEHASGKQAGEVQDDYKKPAKPNVVKVGVDFINDRLGSDLGSEEIIAMLENVEFKVKMGEELTVTAPFWRTDIEIPEDIVEEVGRLYGFNNLPMKLPIRTIRPVSPDPLLSKKRQIRETLARAGANEVQSYSFVHGDLLSKVGQDSKHAFKIRNALSPDLQYYRLSILPSLLEKVHPNIKAGFDEFALFELGKTHYQGEMDEAEPEVPNEDNHLAFVIAYGKSAPQGAAYYQAKKYLEQVAPDSISELTPLSEFNLQTDEWGQQLVSAYNPKRSAVIIRDGQIWGIIGEFKASVQKALKLPVYAAGFELHLDAVDITPKKYTPLSKYPSTEQDLTLKVADDVCYSELEDCMKSELTKTKYQWQLTATSIFQKDGEKTKNITFHITLSHHDRTLKTIEVNKFVEQLVKTAKTQFSAQQV